jgi:hypothetical protein
MTKRFVGSALTLLVAAGMGATETEAQLDVSGSVDFYYAYYLNKVDPQGMRTFDLEHNSFTLGMAEVVLQRAPSETSRIGGRVDLAFGPNGDLVAFFEPSPSYGAGPEIFRNLQQAYISVMANDRVTLDFGKFVTPIGAEVIESQGNMNYSRSVLFGYAIPFYHAGVRVGFAASEQLSLAGYVVNGWNNVTDNNSDKTFIASAALTPNEQLTWYGNFIAGKEGDFGDTPEQDLLWVFDTTLSFAATEMLTLMANFDYGSAANGDPVTAGDPATWWGIAAYARLQAQEDWALAGRFEYLDDSSDGWMFIGEKAQTFTVTSDHTFLQDLIARIELRVDKVESDGFTKEDGEFTNVQPSLTVGLVYVID